METVILGLGSNKGDSRAILEGALLDLRVLLRSFSEASFYKTRPVHIEEQADFLNTACRGIFDGSLPKLLEKIHIIEKKWGRDRSAEIRFGPRSLDIDILFAGKTMLKTENLEVPHPRLFERRFALEPLLELEPDAVDPASGKTLHSICDALGGQGVSRQESF